MNILFCLMFLTTYENIYSFNTENVAIKIRSGLTFEDVKRIAKKYGYQKASKIGDLEGYYFLEHRTAHRIVKRSIDHIFKDKDIEWMEVQRPRIRVKRDQDSKFKWFNDPMFTEQWYLDDSGRNKKLDINVMPVWETGLTGRGIVVTILDDGIEYNHTDLTENYDPNASWDVNDDDSDPFPRYDIHDENKHGTRCAGEVSATANNHICGVGVAFKSKIGGVRMLDGHVTDKVEAASLSLNPQYIDIYSASWGPNDDGKTVEGPGILALAALNNGISKGRNGLGSIYVWASGNGGHRDDDCNCDGYANNIFTLSISSTTDQGEVPWYSESCSSTLASTLSSGTFIQRRIVTTDLHNTCTFNHTGTSASAPIAAGVFALVLEANKKLTWRDVQYLTVYTSNWTALELAGEWKINSIGLHFHQYFGFGLLDAKHIIDWAVDSKWETCPPKFICTIDSKISTRKIINGESTDVVIYVDGCKNTENEIRFIEHTQIAFSLDHSRRGHISIDVISPSNTTSPLLDTRREDDSKNGFEFWTMTTVHFWGETPYGTWTVRFKDNGNSSSYNTGLLKYCRIDIHGTKEKSFYYDKHFAEGNENKENLPELNRENTLKLAHKNRMNTKSNRYRRIFDYINFINYWRYQEFINRYLSYLWNFPRNFDNYFNFGLM